MSEISLAEIQADARKVVVPTAVGDVEVTYRPSLMTPAFEAQVEGTPRPSLVYARDLIAWDLLTDRREPQEYPRDESHLRTLPLGFLEGVRTVIERDIRGDEHVVRDLRRAITSSGNLGAVRWWYPLIRAAKYLGVAPWELAAQPGFWRTWALQAETAETQAHNEMAEQAARKARAGRR